MKVPIDGYSVIDLGAPVLAAEEVKIKGRERWRVWCAHCNVHHLHGPGEGHREAHCNDPASPYRKIGYNLVGPA